MNKWLWVLNKRTQMGGKNLITLHPVASLFLYTSALTNSHRKLQVGLKNLKTWYCLKNRQPIPNKNVVGSKLNLLQVYIGNQLHSYLQQDACLGEVCLNRWTASQSLFHLPCWSTHGLMCRQNHCCPKDCAYSAGEQPHQRNHLGAAYQIGEGRFLVLA